MRIEPDIMPTTADRGDLLRLSKLGYNVGQDGLRISLDQKRFADALLLLPHCRLVEETARNNVRATLDAPTSQTAEKVSCMACSCSAIRIDHRHSTVPR